MEENREDSGDHCIKEGEIVLTMVIMMARMRWKEMKKMMNRRCTRREKEMKRRKRRQKKKKKKNRGREDVRRKELKK